MPAVALPSTRRAREALRFLSRGAPGFENLRAGNRQSPLKIRRLSISRTPTLASQAQRCSECARLCAATHPEAQTPGTLHQAEAPSQFPRTLDPAILSNADDEASESQWPRKT